MIEMVALEVGSHAGVVCVAPGEDRGARGAAQRGGRDRVGKVGAPLPEPCAGGGHYRHRVGGALVVGDDEEDVRRAVPGIGRMRRPATGDQPAQQQHEGKRCWSSRAALARPDCDCGPLLRRVPTCRRVSHGVARPLIPISPHPWLALRIIAGSASSSSPMQPALATPCVLAQLDSRVPRSTRIRNQSSRGRGAARAGRGRRTLRSVACKPDCRRSASALKRRVFAG